MSCDVRHESDLAITRGSVALHAPRQVSLQIGWQYASVPRGCSPGVPRVAQPGTGELQGDAARAEAIAYREGDGAVSGRSRAEAPAGGRAIDDAILFEGGERLTEVEVLDGELAAERDAGDRSGGCAEQAEDTVRE